MNFTISILDTNIDQSQQSFLRTVGMLAKTAVSEFCLFYTTVDYHDSHDDITRS